MGVNDSLLLLVGELHGLEDDPDQVGLHAGVRGHEVAHQDVLQVLRVHTVLSLLRELLLVFLVGIHQAVVLTLQLVEQGDGLLELVFEFVLLLARDLLVFNQLVARGLPFGLLEPAGVFEALVLLQQADHCPVVKFHHVVSQLGRHPVRVSLQVIDLCDAQLDLIQGFSEPVLTALLLTVEHSVDFGLHLA